MVRGDGREDFSHREWVLAIRGILDEFKRELKTLGREEDLLGVRVGLLETSLICMQAEVLKVDLYYVPFSLSTGGSVLP